MMPYIRLLSNTGGCSCYTIVLYNYQLFMARLSVCYTSTSEWDAALSSNDR